jgi:hypothetical protein
VLPLYSHGRVTGVGHERLLKVMTEEEAESTEIDPTRRAILVPKQPKPSRRKRGRHRSQALCTKVQAPVAFRFPTCPGQRLLHPVT